MLWGWVEKIKIVRHISQLIRHDRIKLKANKKEVSNENKNNYEPNLLTYKQKNANL